MRRFKIFLIVFLLVLFSLKLSFAGIEDSKFILDQLLEGKEKPDVALLVIDMQPGVLRSSIDPDEFTGISKFQNELIAYAGSKKIPVINVVIPDVNRKDEYSLLQAMKDVEHKTYYKISNDAFNPLGNDHRLKSLYEFRVSSSTANDGSKVISWELGDYLKSEGIKNVFLTGCFDSYCIAQTAEGALKENFKVYTDKDLNLVRRLDILVPDITGKPTFLSMEQYKLDSDNHWEELESKYPNTLKVLPEDISLTTSSSESECLDS